MTLPTRYLKALLLRGTAVWLFSRVVAMWTISAARAQGMDVGDTLLPLWVIALSPAVVLLDLHRRKETTLLHNLGVTTRFAVTMGSLPSVLLEGVVALVTAVRA